jgi:predicted HTH transcriptional regulator
VKIFHRSVFICLILSVKIFLILSVLIVFFNLCKSSYLTNDIEKYGSGFIRIRKAIADYPTMKFEFHNLGHGFLTEFNYEKQKISLNNHTEIENGKKTARKRQENY